MASLLDSTPLLLSTLCATCDRDRKVRKSALETLIEWNSLSHSQSHLNRSKAVCFAVLTLFVTDHEIRHLARTFMSDCFHSDGFLTVVSSSATEQAFAAVMRANSFANFSDEQFRMVLNFVAGEEFSRSLTWIPRVYHSGMGVFPNLAEVDAPDNTMPTFVGIQLFAVLWESARVCVANRLRTPLGNAVKTFESFEKILKSRALSDRDYVLKKTGDFSSFVPLKATQLQVRGLLLFLDMLAKQIYEAHDGNSSFTLLKSKATSSFFKTNKRVCSDWFNRIRELLITVSDLAGSPADVLRHASAKLASFEEAVSKDASVCESAKFKRDLEYTILKASRAFLFMKSADPLLGLSAVFQKYVSNTDPDLAAMVTNVLQAAALHCKGNYEFALDAYQASIEHLGTGRRLSLAFSSFAIDQITDCIVQLSDWSAWDDWVEKLVQFRSANSQSPWSDIFTGAHKTNYVRALAFYDIGEAKKCRSNLALLENIPTDWESKSSISPSSFPRLIIQSILRHLSTPESAGTDSNDLMDCKGLLDFGTTLFSFPAIGPEAASIWFLERCVGLIGTEDVHLRFPNLSADRIADTTIAGATNMFLRISRPASAQNSLSWLASSPNIQSFLPVKHLRKQGNLRLCQRILDNLPESSSLRYEKCKLSFANGHHLQACRSLLLLINDVSSDAGRETSDSYLSARMRLTLTRWMEHGDVVSSELGQLAGPHAIDASRMQGHLLSEATIVSPEFGEAWLRFGDWNYRRGHKLAEQTESKDLPILLREEDMSAINQILQEAGEPGVQCMTNVMECFSSPSGEGDKDVGNIGDRLQSACPLLGEASINSLATIWYRARQRRLSPFSQAIDCYFRFLTLWTAGANGDEHIVVSLRLLRLLIKYGVELSDKFKLHVKSTPASPWEAVIPQLFARTGQPDEEVRGCIRALISNVGKQFPHTVVYPAVVNQENDILDAVKLCNSRLVREVTIMIEEMTRLTMLWEEAITLGLTRLGSDLETRFKTIRSEAQLVRGNATLSEIQQGKIIKEKYTAIMKPVRVSIANLLSQISATPQSPHERQFLKRYAQPLRALAANLDSVPDYTDIDATWRLFREIGASVAKKVKAMVRLDLAHVSPILSQIDSSVVPMPGLSASEKEVVCIRAFLPNIQVLPSKTKPKKLTILGTNGREYTYLLKGREDLHLDQKCMQLFWSINRILQRNKHTSKRGLSIRRYAVIPFGKRSGLIQWVDGVVPMYRLFKHWQMRSLPPGVAHPPRPSDMFYSKLIPALRKAGVTDTANRASWPIEPLRSAFSSLCNETPSSIIADEMWCAAPCSIDWWRKTETFNRSVAVASMVGYVIGLGDRHLDNILLDLKSGEVVHIDFNICFEKGKKLRVPETVPFRMTQNLNRALGLTGIEGAFRICCEHVLRVLRTNREMLLTLLDAFVYDPLVDWAEKKEHDDMRKNMETNVALSLLASKIQELRVLLVESETHIGQCTDQVLTDLGPQLDYLSESCALNRKAAAQQAELDAIRAELGQLTTEHDQASKTADELRNEIQQLQSSMSEDLQMLNQLWNDMRTQVTQHELLLESLSGSFIAGHVATVLEKVNQAKNLLDSSACEGYREEICSLAEFETALERMQTHLQAYATAVCQQMPEYASTSRCAEWLSWASHVQTNPTEDALTETLEHFGPDARVIMSTALHRKEEEMMLDLKETLEEIQGLEDELGVDDDVEAAIQSAVLQIVEFQTIDGQATLLRIRLCAAALAQADVLLSPELSPFLDGELWSEFQSPLSQFADLQAVIAFLEAGASRITALQLADRTERDIWRALATIAETAAPVYEACVQFFVRLEEWLEHCEGDLCGWAEDNTSEASSITSSEAPDCIQPLFSAAKEFHLHASRYLKMVEYQNEQFCLPDEYQSAFLSVPWLGSGEEALQAEGSAFMTGMLRLIADDTTRKQQRSHVRLHIGRVLGMTVGSHASVLLSAALYYLCEGSWAAESLDVLLTDISEPFGQASYVADKILDDLFGHLQQSLRLQYTEEARKLLLVQKQGLCRSIQLSLSTFRWRYEDALRLYDQMNSMSDHAPYLLSSLIQCLQSDLQSLSASSPSTVAERLIAKQEPSKPLNDVVGKLSVLASETVNSERALAMIVSSILHFEALRDRSSAPAVEIDRSHLAIITRLSSTVSRKDEIHAEEMEIVSKLQSLRERITIASRTTEQLDDELSKNRLLHTELCKRLCLGEKSTATSHMQKIWTNHKLVSESVLPLLNNIKDMSEGMSHLSALAKVNDNVLQCQASVDTSLKSVLDACQHPDSVTQWMAEKLITCDSETLLSALKGSAEFLDDLRKLEGEARNVVDASQENDGETPNSQVGQDETAGDPIPTPTAEPLPQVQTRNAYALNIIKRVKEKLSGRDGSNQKLSASEQVAMVVEQATAVDNLCSLYEGWTSWI